MYQFKITDEPFARWYLSTDSDSKHIRTGKGFVLAAQEMELSIDSYIGLPNASFRNMAVTYTYHCGEKIDVNYLDEKVKENPEFTQDYLYIKSYGEMSRG